MGAGDMGHGDRAWGGDMGHGDRAWGSRGQSIYTRFNNLQGVATRRVAFAMTLSTIYIIYIIYTILWTVSISAASVYLIN